MTLGEKIISLRTAEKLSQGDLAEKLNVSRQSVSKWETGASIPELEKLIQMSEIFHISLDEFVKGEDIASTTTDTETHPVINQTNYTIQKNSMRTSLIVGFILLGVGLLSIVIGCILSILLVFFGIMLSIYGVICIAVKKHPGLICGLVTVVLLVLFVLFFWSMCINKTSFSEENNNVEYSSEYVELEP